MLIFRGKNFNIKTKFKYKIHNDVILMLKHNRNFNAIIVILLNIYRQVWLIAYINLTDINVEVWSYFNILTIYFNILTMYFNILTMYFNILTMYFNILTMYFNILTMYFNILSFVTFVVTIIGSLSPALIQLNSLNLHLKVCSKQELKRKNCVLWRRPWPRFWHWYFGSYLLNFLSFL